MLLQIHRFRQVYCYKHQPSANKRSTFFTRVPFGVLFFFPKSFLNVGGAAYTRVFMVEFKELLVCLPLSGKGSQLEGSNCAVKASGSVVKFYRCKMEKLFTWVKSLDWKEKSYMYFNLCVNKKKKKRNVGN